MFSKMFFSGFVLLVLMCAVPLLFPGPGIGQETEFYEFIVKWGGTGQEDGRFDNWRDGGFPSIRNVAVDSQNNVYVVDGGNRRIQKFNKYGEFILKWGEEGEGDAQFHAPLGIAVDHNDYVYVSENYNGSGRIQKFRSDGLFIEGWPSSHFSFSGLAGIDFDSQGNLYVVTTGVPVVRKFDSNMNYLGGFGDHSSFSYPQDIAVNSKGEIFISNWGEFYCGLPYGHDPVYDTDIHYHSRIKKYDSSFQFVSEWYLDYACAITMDASDNLFICSREAWAMGVYKYDSFGNLIQRIAPNYEYDIDDWEIYRPQGIAVDSEGSVYIHDLLDRVQKFAPPFVAYTFDGFFSPIENAPVVNKAKAGQTIPIKWRITDKGGLPIVDPSSFVNVSSYGVSCTTFEGDPTNPVEEVAAGASGLQYLGDGWWQYNWMTPKSYAGQCRIMRLTLDDKSEHTASFSFK